MADHEPRARSPLSADFPFRAPSSVSLPSAPSLSHLDTEEAPTTSTTESSAALADENLTYDPIPPAPDAEPTEKDNANGSKFYSTPLKDSVNIYGYHRPTDKQRGPLLVNKSGMGPRFRELTVEDFFERLVPGEYPTDEQRSKFEAVDFGGRDVAKFLEKDWYPLLNRTANSVLDACANSKLTFLDTATHKAADPGAADQQEKTGTFNDAGVYWSDTEEARKTTALTEKQLKNSKLSEEEMNARGKVGARSWHWVAIPVEVKKSLQNTAFYFHDPSQKKKRKIPRTEAGGDGGSNTGNAGVKRLIRNSLDGEAALAQFAEYMLNVLNNQHREFCFGIYVWRHMARLCCFDRGAVAVSTEFSWLTTESPLHDFLWKVGHMSREQLGYDPTAKLIEKAEEADGFRALGNNSDRTIPEAIQGYVRNATAPGQPIYKISITPIPAPPDEGLPENPFAQTDKSSDASPTAEPSGSPSTPPAEPKTREFLVGKPHFVTDSLVGRCTRGYVAYDLSTSRLCFIKDYWRPYVPGRSRPEHLIYERLARCGVKNVATLICGGDVGGLRAQMTRLQVLLNNLPVQPVARVHYRMATEEIGLPLEDFKNFRHLALILCYAIVAHSDAWTKANVLHRDISIGNILIDPYTNRGILIDWDQCRLQWELASGPTEPERTGTWPFRSALSLAFPRKPQRLSDDLEAFIHVFRYLVLKYHTTWTQDLQGFVESTFEGQSRVRGIKIGGETKLNHFQMPKSPIEVWENPVLQEVLEAFHRGCYESYLQINFTRMRDLYGILNPRESAIRCGQNVSGDNAAVEDEFPAEEPSETVPIAPHSPVHSTAGGGVDAISDKEADNEYDQVRAESTTAVGTGPNPTNFDSEDPDPCDVRGFLSSHANLTKVLREKYSSTQKALDDKHENQFHFRGKVLGEDIPRHLPRLSTYGISDMSISSNTTDVTPSNLYRSPASADDSLSHAVYSSGKRTRDDQDEDSDAQNAHTPSGDLHTSNGEQPVETRALKKRQRFYKLGS